MSLWKAQKLFTIKIVSNLKGKKKKTERHQIEEFE